MLVLLLSLTVIVTPSSAGGLKPRESAAPPGTWFAGDEPSNGSTDKPVLLFVHGLNGASTTWYENNNMYQTALNNGYHTAFIELYGTKNMWDNGNLLAQKLPEISRHFGKPIVIVAHSKGGLDSQAALTHYNAHQYVSNVITLGSPHHGSQLADLAYSSWAGWLGSILGQKNDATYSLQTSYMRHFRSITDGHSNINRNTYYTLGGTKRDSFGTALYFGHLYLSQFGSNDGAVTLTSSQLPTGRTIRNDSWTHNTIKEGNIFQWFRPYLTINRSSTNEFVESDFDLSASISLPKEENLEDSMGEFLLRGGLFDGEVKESFMVEKEASNIMIDWISAAPVDSLELIGPNNKVQKVEVKSYQDDFMFDGAWHNVMTVKNPKHGEWTIKSSSAKENAYLLTVQFDSTLNKKIKVKENKKNQHWSLDLEEPSVQKNKMKMSYSVDFIADPSVSGKKKEVNVKTVEQQGSTSIQLPEKLEEGVYNITIDVSSEEATNEFQRTIIKSIYVDQNGNVY